MERNCTGMRPDPVRGVLRSQLLLVVMMTVSLGLTDCGDGAGSGNRRANVRIANLVLDASCSEGFSYLSGIRELPDGTILAADPISQIVVRLDMDAGTADTIGGKGAGPQEYDGPDRVFPLPGDSSLLVDLGNSRLTVIDPEGRFVEWIPMVRTTSDGNARSLQPRYVDAAGHLYMSAPFYQESPPDTTIVHRVERGTWEETPVAWSWRTEYVRRPRDAKRPMLVAYDSWAVGDDGSIAVVRANGYSVDWYLPDGSVVRGPPNEVERFPVELADKKAELEKVSATGIFTMTEVGEGGTRSMRYSRGIPPGLFGGVDAMEWPESLPLFRVEGTIISPGREAWVHRVMPAGVPVRVDVFDISGNLKGFVELPAGGQVIGFGKNEQDDFVAYVARRDELGLVWLERYRIDWHQSATRLE